MTSRKSTPEDLPQAGRSRLNHVAAQRLGVSVTAGRTLADVASGLTYRQIARREKANTTSAICVRIERLRIKFNAASTPQLIAFAYAEKLLEVDRDA
jgi:hypothetical protein